MRPYLSLLFALMLFSCSPTEKQGTDLPTNPPPIEMVDPFIGTGGHGHTFPGATMPFGMVQLSPDTRLEGWDGCSGYHFSDSIVYGFSHTHLSGTGVSDYGDVLLMPVVGTPSLYNGYPDRPDSGYASIFDKTTETASPGHYGVTLDEGNVKVELTATAHCGIHKYDFGTAEKGAVIVDLAHRDEVLEAQLTRVSETEIEGFRFSKGWAEKQRVYFVVQFSSPFDLPILQENRPSLAGSTGPVAALTFSQLNNTPLEVKVGISPVDIEGARNNLKAETSDKDFAALLEAAQSNWSKQLSLFEIKGGDESQLRSFYTAVYHSFLAPNLFSDEDQRTRDMDGKIRQLDRDSQYTVFSLWDTFRATHPLLTILEPKRTSAFIRTFLRQYESGGHLPIWELAGNYTGCMIGYHSIPVIADAYAKGLVDFDTKLALEAMVHSADLNWLGLEAYKDHGYIGAGEEPESVSKTLEYAYDDWCIAMMAEGMGETEIAERFYVRSENYQHLFDPQTKFFRARMNGGWQSPFDPKEVNFNFTEANAWQYSGFVPQNVHNLIALHGGPADFGQHLDSLFMTGSQTTGRDQSDITGLIGQYAHGNEPSHHMAYLYAYISQASKGQQRLRQIMDELYSDQPDGLSGNEDCGQMSSWLVFSAMGFYPVTPGTDEYVLGTPLFPELSMTVGKDKRFTVRANNLTKSNLYVQGVSLNGKALDRIFIRHAEVMAGGELVFEMGPEPDDSWYHTMPGKKRASAAVPCPIVVADHQTFTDSLAIGFETAIQGLDIWYTLDGQSPENGTQYTGKTIVIDKTVQVRAVAKGENGKTSSVVKADFFKIEGGRSIVLKGEYANEYAAGGDGALIDYLRGGANFRTGRWQGYREDFEGTVDLGEVKKIKEVEVGFLQDIKSWIWMPKNVEIAASKDGSSWEVLKKGGTGISDTKVGAITGNFKWKNNAEARFIRVQAEQYGVCPPWHMGAGGATWIFIDEISIQ